MNHQLTLILRSVLLSVLITSLIWIFINITVFTNINNRYQSEFDWYTVCTQEADEIYSIKLQELNSATSTNILFLDGFSYSEEKKEIDEAFYVQLKYCVDTFRENIK